MDNESNSPYNTIMNTELKISVRENVTIPGTNKPSEDTAIHCNDVSLSNPYSDIQVFTSPEQRPAHLTSPPGPVASMPSRNMSTDQFLSLLNQLITTQEPLNPGYPTESTQIATQSQKQRFKLNSDFSIDPVTQQHTITMDDMHTVPYRRDSEEKRVSLSKSFSVPSLLHLSSQTKYDNIESNKGDNFKNPSQPADTHFLPPTLSHHSTTPTVLDPPNLVCGPQTADQLPPGVIVPLPHPLTPATPQLMPSLSEFHQDQTIKNSSIFTPPSQSAHYSLSQLPHASRATNHQRTHSSSTQQSEDLLGQLELLRKREQMLQTAKMQLEEKYVTLQDTMDNMEVKQHRYEQELNSMMRIRSEQDQKNTQLEQYNQLQQQQLESSRQHVTQLERRVEGLMQQCRLKDEANSQNSELYKKLDAADKMINVFQERLDSSRLQLSQQEALINSLDTRARAAESALVQSQQDSSVLHSERVREKERYSQELQRVQTDLQADKKRREQEMARVRHQLIQENEKFKEEYNRLREEYDNQKKKFDRLLEEFRLTQTELGRKQSFISELEQESRDRQTEVGNLKAAVSKYESMEDNYKRTIMRQEEDIRHLHHTNNRLHSIGSIQTFQGQSDVAKFQFHTPSSQLDSPSTYPRTPTSAHSRRWTDISPEIPHEGRSSSALADPICPPSTRTTAAAHVWPSDSDSDYPEPVSRPSDTAPYRGGYESVRRQHPTSQKEKLNCSFDLTYPLSSGQHDRVKTVTPHSEPRKRMTWIAEENERGGSNGISDEEKYKLLMSLDQPAYHKSQPYKSTLSAVRLDKVSEIEEMYDSLQNEKQLLESALNRGSGRTSRQSRQKREDLECRLEEVMKELGSIRMKLRVLGILKT